MFQERMENIKYMLNFKWQKKSKTFCLTVWRNSIKLTSLLKRFNWKLQKAKKYHKGQEIAHKEKTKKQNKYFLKRCGDIFGKLFGKVLKILKILEELGTLTAFKKWHLATAYLFNYIKLGLFRARVDLAGGLFCPQSMSVVLYHVSFWKKYIWTSFSILIIVLTSAIFCLEN